MLGTHQDGGIGVFLKMKKQKRKNYGGKYRPFLYLTDRIQKNFNQKRLKIKMPSVMPFSFNAVGLCVVTINEKPWIRAREVRWVLEYGKATKVADVARHLCSKTNYAHKWQLTGLVSEMKPVD